MFVSKMSFPTRTPALLCVRQNPRSHASLPFADKSTRSAWYWFSPNVAFSFHMLWVFKHITRVKPDTLASSKTIREDAAYLLCIVCLCLCSENPSNTHQSPRRVIEQLEGVFRRCSLKTVDCTMSVIIIITILWLIRTVLRCDAYTSRLSLSIARVCSCGI